MVSCRWNGSKKPKWRRLPTSLEVLLQKVYTAKTEDLQLWLDDIKQQIIVFMIPNNDLKRQR